MSSSLLIPSLSSRRQPSLSSLPPSPSSGPPSPSLTRLLQEIVNVQFAKEKPSEPNNKRKSCSREEEDEKTFLTIFRSLHQTMGGNLFEKVVKQVDSRLKQNRPRFPHGIVVSNIPRNQEMESKFQQDAPLTDGTAITEEQSKNAEEEPDMNKVSFSKVHRIPPAFSPGRIGVQQVRDIQFQRWNWCCENMDAYVNMLRQSGHSDESISDMIHDGQPLCIPSSSLFQEFKESLRELQTCLEKDTGWTNISFVLTGSSVCGFSQSFPPPRYSTIGVNVASHLPSGGVSDTLTVCVQANGVKHFMDDLLTCGSIGTYATTCTPCMGGLRYRFLQEDAYSLVSEYLSTWYKDWSSKLCYVGLEITFGEDSLVIPPWETRLNMFSTSKQEELVQNGALVSPLPTPPRSPLSSPTPCKRLRI
eukprot:CAMPEP_0194172970 /NCGR_PEP_ID=MMETSP0154-20130528/7364_1 /TAXON_ID=1049557 /ORGANISM="Thalassiothrix antarctica, Strain L6-D1" /LENGTH=416 /DNA_ID=CAMNT_0038885845 /DNA_START=25 /DNA_END=1275 /DNA_ORIENTATION=-